MSIQRRVPAGTYRLQFNRDFTFRHALEAIDYLHELGISDVYCSPLFKAGPSSTHGYDVCAFDQLNPNLGTEAEFDSFTRKLHENGMGLLLDMVPNHMGNDCANPWLMDVLTQGKASKYAQWFDIDWESCRPDLKGKLLLPILEDHYGKVLESGKLRLAHDNGNFQLKYYDRAFPVADQSQEQLSTEASSGSIETVLSRYNGSQGEAQSFDPLHQLIAQQHYRLAYWRLAGEIINYRRFFDVAELIAVRMELAEVFATTHALVFRWIKEEKVTGLRIDHPDGLLDPREYLKRLQEELADGTASRFYIVAEKILTGDERLPRDWPIEGTTGYDFLNQVNGLFVERANEQAFTEFYHEFTGCTQTFEAMAREAKRKVLLRSFGSEVDRLSRLLLDLASVSRYGQDLTWQSLRTAVVEIISAFPVYRTYVTRESRELNEVEQQQVDEALAKAKKATTNDLATAIDFIGSLLLLKPPRDLGSQALARCREFVLTFQQLTGPVTAKGVEDTAFYNYNRLVSLNEVGGDPGRFGVSVDEFHRYNRITAEFWPHSLLATATHDTKRGEDVRARINVLSEMPDQWRQAVQRWRNLNRKHDRIVHGSSAPDANDQYLVYQTLIGAWPEQPSTQPAVLTQFHQRVEAYLLKAIRESKRHTSWTDPDSDYEQAVKVFIENLLDGSTSSEFLQDFLRFQSHVAYFGRLNSLSQTLLKLTCPGSPDIYQGTELWDLSLVDPDNRRPVDFNLRKKLLAQVKKAEIVLPSTEVTAETKMSVIWRTLQFRCRHTQLFQEGAYQQLEVTGTKKEHVCAFARIHGAQAALIVVPRLMHGLTGGDERLPTGEIWGDTAIDVTSLLRQTEFHNVFTHEKIKPGRDRSLPLRAALSQFSVALLVHSRS